MSAVEKDAWFLIGGKWELKPDPVDWKAGGFSESGFEIARKHGDLEVWEHKERELWVVSLEDLAYACVQSMPDLMALLKDWSATQSQLEGLDPTNPIGKALYYLYYKLDSDDEKAIRRITRLIQGAWDS